MPSINSQVADAVRKANDATIGRSAGLSMAFTFTAAANSLGLVMQNAAAVQQASQQVAQASVATTCALMITKGS